MDSTYHRSGTQGQATATASTDGVFQSSARSSNYQAPFSYHDSLGQEQACSNSSTSTTYNTSTWHKQAQDYAHLHYLQQQQQQQQNPMHPHPIMMPWSTAQTQ